MLIADSHEFIELYRGDKDLRLASEITRLRGDVRVVSFAPNAASPAEDTRLATERLTAASLPPLPEAVDVRLLPSHALRFARKEVGGIVAWMPGYRRALLDARPDVVMEVPYTWLTPRSYATDRAARKLGIPVVYYDPGDDVPVSPPQAAVLPLERPVVLRASAVVSTNEVGKRRFERKYGYPSERIHVIPKPMDVPRWRTPEAGAAAREELGIAPGAFVVAYSGRLTKFRGSVLLADAARRAAADPRLADVVFLFVGGPLNSQAAPGAFEGANMIVTGMLSNDRVPAMLAAADVVVFPDLSSHAGFTTTVAEAMAAARPLLVGFDPAFGAVPLVPGVTCERVEPGDVDALVEGLARLRADEPYRRSLGEAVGRYASERMDYPRVAAAYLGLLDEVVARGR
jgi:glycosyltransferase involved in cell wall biosynthesis